MSHLFKTRLQNYAQKNNLPFPTYACEMQGPPHARLFKAQVTIDSATYEGPDFYTTLKDAEHAAAKVAFMALSPDVTQEDDCMYKSLLQELAQKEGFLLPVYVTNRTGPSHMPSFSSKVEISGQCFDGQEARSKKQAEMNAAKVAYTALTEGGPNASNAGSFKDIQMMGSSSIGSPSVQTVVNSKKETTPIPTTGMMQTTINNQAGYSIANEAVKARVTPNVVDATKLNIKRENVATQSAQAHEGFGSNEIKIQPFVSSRASNQVTDARPHKIVIRPRTQDMRYDGPIVVSDEEWVAMKVKVDDET